MQCLPCVERLSRGLLTFQGPRLKLVVVERFVFYPQGLYRRTEGLSKKKLIGVEVCKVIDCGRYLYKVFRYM